MIFSKVITLLVTLLYSKNGVLADSENLSLCAFNLQIFGDTKFGRESLGVQIYIDQTVRHDVMLLQEIRDKDSSSMYALFDKIKEVAPKYKMAMSERLGRTSSKEQYVYLYRSNKLKLDTSYVYPDPTDIFERPPYIAKFSVIGTNFAFAMIGIHAKASSKMTFDEIQALYDVAENVKVDLNLNDIVIIGDLNADCSYLSNSKKSKLNLVKDTSYHWAIGNNEDTTVKESTNCAYDRIIYTGDTLKQGFERYGVVNLEVEYNIGEKQAGKISDHYPVYAVFNIK
ncbi:deoxyribonuclease-1-like isoform X2 [Convolutriloba macropyga]|uniref:deoxyribonuclease-1-like isoform X2 n=1 Tax=Convolutriloba macropyga TaxID=536237 RepID=UPI003F51DB2F